MRTRQHGAGLRGDGNPTLAPRILPHRTLQLVLAMDAGDDARVAAALARVGVVTEREEPALQARLAYGMFDTRGK